MEPKNPPHPRQIIYKSPHPPGVIVPRSRSLSFDGIIRPPKPSVHTFDRPSQPVSAPNYRRATPILRPSDYPKPISIPKKASQITSSNSIHTYDHRTHPLINSSPVARVHQVPQSTKAITKRHRITAKLQMALLIIVCGVVGLSVYNLAIGQAAIGVYAITALLLRIKSQTTFALALMALACVPLMSALRPANQLAENFAVYAFLLLVVGVVSAALELRKEDKEDS